MCRRLAYKLSWTPKNLTTRVAAIDGINLVFSAVVGQLMLKTAFEGHSLKQLSMRLHNSGTPLGPLRGLNGAAKPHRLSLRSVLQVWFCAETGPGKRGY
jgi:hypothetical protein